MMLVAHLLQHVHALTSCLGHSRYMGCKVLAGRSFANVAK